jgi:hypothetical protein
MRVLIIFSLLFFSSLFVQANQPKVTKKFNKELVKYFNSENIKINEIIELSNNKDIFFKIFDDDKELGLVVLTSAIGRHDKFDYMIIYNQNKEIKLIKILVYRSDYGSEITGKRWLSQFYSKQKDSIKYGSDIQAISGATFSAISLTKNINRINRIVRNYNKTY